MDIGQPSRTAENAAIMRALHKALPPEARVFNDPLATRIIIPDGDAYRSRVVLLERLPAALRARFTIIFCARDMRRIVSPMPCNVAALASLSPRRRIGHIPLPPTGVGKYAAFEVDHPATQGGSAPSAAGRHCEPANLQFASVDFVDTTLEVGRRGRASRRSNLLLYAGCEPIPHTGGPGPALRLRSWHAVGKRDRVHDRSP